MVCFGGFLPLDKQKIYDSLMKMGRCAGCHQLPERSFFYHGYQFPICARCTGVLIGQTIGVLTFALYRLSWSWCSFFLFLMFFDWFLQRMKILQSTNIRRLITGGLCGYGLGQCYVTLLLKIITSQNYNFYLRVVGGIV